MVRTPEVDIETAFAVVVPRANVPAVRASSPLPAATPMLPDELTVNLVDNALSNFKKFPVKFPPPWLSKSIYIPLPAKIALSPPVPSFIIFPLVMALAVASNKVPVVIVVEFIFSILLVVSAAFSIANT